MVAGLAAPLAVWALSGLLDSLERSLPLGPGSDAWANAVPWLGAVLVALAAQSAETAGTFWLAQRAGLRIDAAIQGDMFAKAVSVPLASFDRADYYTHLETGRNAQGAMVAAVFDTAQLARAAVGTVGLLAVFARAHWLIAAVLVGMTLFRAAVGARLSRAYSEVQFGTSPFRREQGYWGGLLASRGAAPEIRLFGLLDHLIGRWRGAFDRYLAEASAARWRTARHMVLSQAMEEAVNLIALLFLLVLALRGAVTVGTLVALLYGLARLRENVSTISFATARQVEKGTRLGHLRAFLALPDESRPALPRVAPRPLRDGVRFDAVSFAYPSADRPVLSDIDLSLRPGERIALVGQNGAGKTTLVRLLLGLYAPTGGRITVDGIDLREIDPAEWRRECTAVFQDYVRYLTTVSENVAYGDVALLAADASPGAPHAGARVGERAAGLNEGVGASVHPRVVAAARLSGADAVAAALPGGYATPLGKEFAGGAELSTGQWQRLALARAYVRQAQVVVLDEPTAALDPRGEVELYRQFAATTAGRCAVLISHRLGAARLADRIVVLRDGRVAAEGDHDTLLRRGGEYAEMYRLQAAWYADA